ncbi:hypothetical protein [Skermania piniformis]|uniref:Uncharacterized protein n=1 Tax=Skermania pinensis TaxID=39122 RepID=A0ABX8SAH7_9ACTN|nr:hypothetical protein [Skermania piniformis]QXQ14868.1 hypothetical protein KV203_05655 [Skermania piniformis]
MAPDLEHAQLQELAITVDCRQPGCAQPAGVLCVNVHTGELLRRLPAHPLRIRDARKAANR